MTAYPYDKLYLGFFLLNKQIVASMTVFYLEPLTVMRDTSGSDSHQSSVQQYNAMLDCTSYQTPF